MHMIVRRKPVDHYKLVMWTCATIVKENLGSLAFCEVGGLRLITCFFTYAANINGLKLGCLMILLGDDIYLSRPYKGLACTLRPRCRQPHVQFCICYSVG